MSVFDGHGNPIKIGTGSTEVFAGKRALWLGDSISVKGDVPYPKVVCNSLGMALTNKASSGGNSVRMRNILEGTGDYAGKPVDLKFVDYVFIMIGHNCDSPEEGLTRFDQITSSIDDIPKDGTTPENFPTTFHGNVGSCVEYVWREKPAAKIFLITPIQGATARYAKTTPAARKALLELGIFYSIPVIDVYATAWIAAKDINKYTYDGVHPNELGIERIATDIEGFLMNR